MTKWDVSSWLVLVRCLQILGMLMSASLNGSLLVYIYANNLGLSQVMCALEIMTCVALIYTALVLLIQHTGRRRIEARTSLIATFVVGDVIFTGLMIGVITMLARSGVPSNCEGLTKQNFEKGDAPTKPPDGYSTILFGDGSADNKGALDKYCALERGYYSISVAIIFTYMLTITLSILRVYEGLYTKNSVVKDQLATASELYRLETKLSKTHRPDTHQSYSSITGGYQPSSASSPLEQGLTSPRTTAASPISPTSTRYCFRDNQQNRRPTMPPVSPLTSPTITLDPARESLLVMQHREDPAEAAVITDGFMGGQLAGGLPPYTPGESSARFMAGHGEESNEIRLSDYVKGGTRAQAMKDSGNL